MNFVHSKNYTILVFTLVVLLGFIPGTIISEPQYKATKSPSTPLTILYSGITKFDTSNALLIRIDSTNPDDLASVCDDTRILIDTTDNSSTIQWKPGKNCKIPLISYKGKNYILPLSQANISLDALSDVSTETLKNTLAITTLLNTDTKLSTLRTRKIIRNIGSILEVRNNRFLLPIEWTKLPEKDTHLPNSARPFRADTTDWIHHGWDFYVNQGAPVRAVEDGQIVHIKRDFSWKEMDHLHDASSELGQQENLDIYRWNTVYLKTLSGHVAIYAHMADIPSKLEVGDYVAAGTIVWHVWDSAVPDKKYLYHLHFELAMNPFRDEKAGTYTFEDYLVWPWFGKGKSIAWVRENDNYLFQ
jgi:murein DD-endopeptidase MepM/ murein hydrolase activator NlpD